MCVCVCVCVFGLTRVSLRQVFRNIRPTPVVVNPN